MSLLDSFKNLYSPKPMTETKLEVVVKCKGSRLLDIDEMHEFQGDLKELSTQDYEKFKRIMLRHGYSYASHVWLDPKTNKWMLLDGHQRKRLLTRMRAEGYFIPLLPVVEVEADSWEQAKEKLLAGTAQYGKMTDQGLYEFINDANIDIAFLDDHYRLPEIDINKFREEFFSDPTNSGLTDEDSIPEVVEPKTKLGDVFILGEHRLMCGDSTSIGAVEKLMNGENAEISFTSPPYADQREYGGGKELSTKHLAKFISTAKTRVKYFIVNLGYSRQDGEVNTYWDDYIAEAKSVGLKMLSWNIWDRASAFSIGQQTAMFPIEHEWIFVLGETTKKLSPTIPNKHAGASPVVTNRESDGSLSKASVYSIRSHRELGTVIRLGVDRDRSVDHPAKFPVCLPEEYIEAMTSEKEIIYEPFGGSGSTLIACEKTNRKCFMMELDPHYCDVIITRWENFTGKKAVKIDI